MGDERESLKERKFGWTIGIDNDCSYVWDCGLKDFSPIKCNEEEIAFIKKWGLHTAKSTLPIWICTDNSRKAEYYELEENYSLFSELLNEYYEDLKLYALMYRNVPLYNISNDALSVLYFVSKKDEIIGFKEKLQKENSLKSQIAFLYYANEALFPKFCIKYANVNFQHNRIASEFKIDTIRNFKNGNFTKILSINDLTEEECEKILSKKNRIASEYPMLCYKYMDENLNHNIFENCDKTEFAENFYIPIMKSTLNHYDIIQEHLSQRNGLSQFTQDKHVFSAYDINIEEYVKKIKRKISELEIKILKLEFNTDYFFFKKSPQHISDEIEILQNQIKDLENEVTLKKRKNKGIVECATNQLCFKYLYENLEKVERSILRQLELSYNNQWLNDAEKRRNIESKIYNAPSICSLPQNEFKPEKGVCIYKYVIPLPFKKYSNTSKLKNGPIVFFNNKGLLTKWCNTIDEEVERLEKIEHEKREEKERELRLRREREEKQRRREEEARRVKFEYNKRNKHFRDSDLSFDESTHLYKVDGVILQSVTNFVKGCFPKFDAEYHAKRKAEQLGIALEEVLEMWERKGEESRELGTELHKRIENYYQGIISNVDDKTFNLFKMFADKVELKPYRTEWAVYDLKHNIAGTIDFVDYQNGEYIIYDWKRSEKIIDNGIPVKINKYGEKGNYPLEHLDNTPYYHYALQLSLYKYILEKNYGMKISDLRLGVFHPTYNKPYVLRMPYLEKEINDIFNLRSEVIF